MLVLSRDCDTAVKIGSGIRIKVLSIQRQRVKLGVEAPNDVRIWREEVPVNDWKSNSSDARPIQFDTAFDSSGCRNVFDRPILVVGGEPEQAAFIRNILSDHGCKRVTVVSSGSKTMKVILESCETDDANVLADC